MKKIGYSALFICTGAAMCAYYISRKRIDFQNKLNYFTEEKLFEATKIYNPKSTFIEFFDKKNVEEYIDLGLNKDYAFKAVVEDDRNT
jgi:hypothetical protein